ncbi:hypothetical protein Taro_012896 [Colocasia esculenta]|uniref:F-box protein n=1 Tax=Colocasia esculenta TaxID=4460 RepID=A0A843UAI5_COLES|nr:hypothetical protein [Colocasia esculenta]
MAAVLQARNFLLPSSSSPSVPCRRVRPARHQNHIRAAAMPSISLVKAPKRVPVEEFLLVREIRTASTGCRDDPEQQPSTSGAECHEDQVVTAKLYAVMEAAADRAGMHDAIGAQRDNWNTLLLGSVNSITLAASVAAGLSAIPAAGVGSHHEAAFKASSVLMYSAATAMLLVMNKIQPSQLAEEQRNAARLFRQLEKKIQTILALGRPTSADVEDAVERVLALDRAYPLSLLPGMLDKFPEAVEPTVWWPKLGHRPGQATPQKRRTGSRDRNNGWSEGLERVMSGVLRVLKKNDTAEYLREAKLALGVNTVLAAAGPLLTGVATIGASLVDAGNPGSSWPLLLGVVSGSLAVFVNTLEHGGQVGMVFEMYRNCAGFYRQMEEEIELHLEEEDTKSREEAELFELKVALQLGRSLSELRGLSSHSCSRDEDIRESKRNAGRLLISQEKKIRTTLALGRPSDVVEYAMERVLALGRACPVCSTSSPSPSSRRYGSRHGNSGADRPSYLSLPSLPLFPATEDDDLLAKGGQQVTDPVGPGRRPWRTATGGEDHVDRGALSKLYAVLEAVADRAEMHAIIGAQRDNWNALLLGSVNSITLAAALMAGLSAVPDGAASPSCLAFKLSSALLYAAATGMLVVMNRIQPSQLVEEQRNAARLFRQLEKSIRTGLSLRKPAAADVDRAMERVLALDRAYPLPLLGGMLDKFPKAVQPTVWWPKPQHRRPPRARPTSAGNGWSEELEKEMEGVVEALKRKDIAEYVRLGKLALKVNRALAVSGPLLTGLAGVATSAIDPSRGPWPVVAGVGCGVLAAVVNAVEHGGQVGMVFELFRNLAGYYEQLEEMIEANLRAEEGEEREDGEVLEVKVALQLGRPTSELKNLAASSASSSSSASDDPGFAGKLF